ncbi:hypothetical protein N7489_001536 [Penicillium chrysogenum]|uniref:uncharacterized protein n=1 Tax=Penicillium chrysogenum TaxID=5076 RepID=UPI00239768B0|nr:uncharacterized protein N7489_001536 [Penicillium chrysogenum]KAJ5251126.1 hypothetical protein N7489_001536 [Penicillium chrysogenum]KAJ5262561.1 hypothetical protein N7524_007866 [Penicillium chrysogenum]
MTTQTYKTVTAHEVTDTMLEEAAKLFSENYGIWGRHSGKAGDPVKLSARRLRQQYLPNATDTVVSYYVMVTVDGYLAGNAFACRWKCDGMTVCWVTQLVVDKDYRDNGLATGLLRSLRKTTDDIYGIMSSHPAACLAAAKSFGTTIEKISLDFIRRKAHRTMKSSPIPYIQNATLRGTIFQPEDTSGMVSGVNTGFFVDHEEPQKVLQAVRGNWQWPLGDLPDGHEYLLVMPAKHRRPTPSSLPLGEAGRPD